MKKKDELIKQKERLFQEHIKKHNEIMDKIDEWEKKYGNGGLDSSCPYWKDERKLTLSFWEENKKINAELEKLKY